MESISTVAEKLRYYRCQAGLTITQLAERSGITVVSLSKYENGHKAPQIQLLRAICTALNIQSHLITDADKMPEDTLQERYEKARMLQCYTRREINSEIGLSHKSVNAVLVGRRNALPETITKIENYCNKILNEYRQ